MNKDSSIESRLRSAIRGCSPYDLRMFACRCAENVFDRSDSPPYPHSIEAIRVSRLHADGKATDMELTAVRSHAWNASARASTLANVQDAAFFAAHLDALNAASYALNGAIYRGRTDGVWMEEWYSRMELHIERLR